jgi:hypothetical protein
MTDEIDRKVAILQQLTKMEISVARTTRLVKVVDKRNRDILGCGWKDPHAALCHIDTAITFTMMNKGYEKDSVPASEQGGGTG